MGSDFSKKKGLFKAYEGNQPYIFASYKHADSDIIYPMLKQFNDLGFNIWYDDGLQYGEDYDDLIDLKIEESSLFIICITERVIKHARDKDEYMKKELDVAIETETPILPIFIHDVKLKGKYRMQLRGKHSIFKFEYAREDEFLNECADAFENDFGLEPESILNEDLQPKHDDSNIHSSQEEKTRILGQIKHDAEVVVSSANQIIKKNIASQSDIFEIKGIISSLEKSIASNDFIKITLQTNELSKKISEVNDSVMAIDFGENNSVACANIGGKATIVYGAEGETMYGKTFPSYVAFTEDGELLVGEMAKKQAYLNPENTVKGIKRHIGEDYKVEIQGKTYTPQQISTFIFEKIKRDAEAILGEVVSKAAITVPAYFNLNEIFEYLESVEKAGFEVIRFLEEPVAASLAYGIHECGDDLNILVFDMGEDSLDVSILKFSNGMFDVLSTNRDDKLGGKDIDLALKNYLAKEFEDEYGINLLDDPATDLRLKEASERAKVELSDAIETEVKLPFIAEDDDNKPINYYTSITRSKFDGLVNSVVCRCGKTIQNTLDNASMVPEDIDKVILVGGSSKMPFIQEYVEDFLGKEVEKGIDPMECVSIGANIPFVDRRDEHEKIFKLYLLYRDAKSMSDTANQIIKTGMVPRSDVSELESIISSLEKNMIEGDVIQVAFQTQVLSEKISEFKYESKTVMGIDFGTNNSVACVDIGGKATIVPSAEGVNAHVSYGKTFPSYVAFTDEGELLVGQPAKIDMWKYSENTVKGIKRHMGTDYKVEIQGKSYTPQQISTFILKKIRRDAEAFSGEDISEAVIAVPAYFDDVQRNAIADAGHLAGLNVQGFLSEPAAACLAYGIHESGDDLKILIFDMSEDTLEVTLMEYGYGIFEVQSAACDTLGGKDIDVALKHYLADEFEDEYGINLLDGYLTNMRLDEAAERAKIDLSNEIEAEVNLPFIAEGDDNKPINYYTSITRSKLEGLMNPILQRCGVTIQKALDESLLVPDDLDKVILIGGGSKMPAVKEYVEDFLEKEVETGIDPIECVARGAAIQAYLLARS